jgi:glycosyltransferase involved in cell wall biosynthesis
MSAIRVAYLVKRFPRLSETFVLNEFLEVRRLGLEISIFALMDTGEKVVHPAARELVAEVRYLTLAGKPWSSRWRLLCGAVAQLATHPRGLLRVVWALLSVHRSMQSLRHAFEGAWLARELRRRRVDHLHAHFAHSPAAVAYMARLAGGPPFSFTAHAKDLYTTLPRNLAIRANAARFVLTCTDFNGRFLRELLPEVSTPIQVIHHGADLRRFNSSGRQPKPGLILSVGRLVPKKGYPLLIQGLQLVEQAGLEFRCEIYGGGPMREELDSMVRARGLASRISFHGARPQDELVRAYARASLFVLAPVVVADGDRDGIPNVLVEAMASGVPVVSTRISGIPELIEDGANGLLVEPGDAAGLAEAIKRLLINPQLASRLAAAGRLTVQRDFDLAVNSRRVANVLAGIPGTAVETRQAVVA